MKNGKRPNKAQKQAMTAAGLNYGEWLVVKSLPDKLHIVHRSKGELKEIVL
ncbi:DUF6906 family protein [Priestia flexa]|jgi:hypothetical protein|uniref:DUF6906 family protein n=1 Tax=Priestia flexa TaxID=86664 RepID=UPI003D06C8F5